MKRRAIVYACLLLAGSSLAQSTIQFTAIHMLPSNQVRLIWSSDASRWYILESGAGLLKCLDDFEAVLPDLTANPGTNMHTVLVDDVGGRFYRVTGTPPVGPYDNIDSDDGTAGNDTQIQAGTASTDMIVQFGKGGNDIQYASGGGSSDWIEQHGEAGTNNQHAYGGTGDDCILQEGGESNDSSYALGDDGDDWIIQHGGEGHDNMQAAGGSGDDHLWQNGAGGHDAMDANTGGGSDTVVMCGGDGNDTLTYDASEGSDSAFINGGGGYDTLIVNERDWSLAIRLPDGADLWTNGLPDTVITVLSLEAIYVVDGDGATHWAGAAP